MMKGHVKIELFDHKTGKLKQIERENMLTNALAYRAGIDSNDTLGLYSSEYSIMPLGTKGLGGLYLFDGPLTEDRTTSTSRWMYISPAAQDVAPAIRPAAFRGQSTTQHRDIPTGHTPRCGTFCQARAMV